MWGWIHQPVQLKLDRMSFQRNWLKITACSASLALLVGGVAQRSEAKPLAQFAMTCIGTETGDSVNFQYRWGEDDKWSSALSVSPGRWKILTYDYDYPGENRSPKLQIRFDDDLSSDTNMVVVTLKSYAASSKDCEEEGKTYNFYQDDMELNVRQED